MKQTSLPSSAAEMAPANVQSRGERVIGASEAWFRRLLWVLVAYGAAVWLIGLYEWFRYPLAQSPYNAFNGHPAYRAFALFIGAPIVAAIGYLILRRQRNNTVGLLLLMWSGAFASFGISVHVNPVLYDLVSFPITAWWTTFIFVAIFFPDGRAYPRWLTPMLLFITAWALLNGLTAILSDPQLDFVGGPPNPFFVPAAQVLNNFTVGLYFAMGLPLIPVIFISPWLRYRQADYVQRQQIKAFTWWSMLLLTPYVIFYFVSTLTYDKPSDMPFMARTALQAFVGLIGLGPPIVIGYSILRHKLFDIDVVIRRTLVYTVVTALLAVTFYGLVLVLQRLLTVVTGQQSPVALVASTLVIAALFSPLRRRVQDFVDRRFYRRKYDAQQVLSQFAAMARDETDIHRLAAGLETAVEETMRPGSIGTWLQRS